MAHQSRAVQFDQYGDIDVLEVRDVPRPQPGPGEVLVRVKAAGINPGEAMIRKGAMHDRWPATFPSGQGSDLAGVVADVAADVQGFAVGDEVLGFTDARASQAEFVVVPAGQLTAKPAGVPWDVAGALFVAGTTAYAAVDAVRLTPGDVVFREKRREDALRAAGMAVVRWTWEELTNFDPIAARLRRALAPR